MIDIYFYNYVTKKLKVFNPSYFISIPLVDPKIFLWIFLSKFFGKYKYHYVRKLHTKKSYLIILSGYEILAM